MRILDFSIAKGFSLQELSQVHKSHAMLREDDKEILFPRKRVIKQILLQETVCL
jgi:hypothetical protein